MWSQHIGCIWNMLLGLASALVFITIVGAQEPRQQQTQPRLRNQGGIPAAKKRPEAGDPLAKAASTQAKGKTDTAPPGTYHYTFKLRTFEGTLLAASYYPSRLGVNAPVVMLVHESGRSRKDFEEPVSELKGRGIAEHLQDEGYAVFSMDLRGQGQNPRRVPSASDRLLMMEDLQAAYHFLLDRHNRGEFNMAKLGVVALGEGANLTAAWANQAGAAISTEGRATDLNAIVLISPFPDGSGYVLNHVLASLAPRIPIALLVGSKDVTSKDAVESARRIVLGLPLTQQSGGQVRAGIEKKDVIDRRKVELDKGEQAGRLRLNRVEFFPSPLHGYKLVRLEPKITTTILHFLEATIKLRPAEWEPRYNLAPVTTSEILTVSRGKTAERGGPGKQDQVRPKNEAKGKDSAKAETKDKVKER
jgi:acetyl esterase/lipase